jgi:L-seryl-tRNA(Ser) seleniumtransferase
VDALLERRELERFAHLPRSLLVSLARREVDAFRSRLLEGEEEADRAALSEAIVERVVQRAKTFERSGMGRVINATGVVVHTNLGRSRLSERARRALDEAASSYVNLEVDLESGERSKRGGPLFERLAAWLGAEKALAVNNNAAAVWLSVSVLSRSGRVIVSRGELVEIGGSFRLPEILALASPHVVEVGTTNRTRIADYRKVVCGRGDVLLKVHPSNYSIRGFTEEATLEQLAALGRERNCPVVYDLGSGSPLDLQARGLPGEPTPQEALRRGADLVTMSGDKLWGGPQAGILVGRASLLERLESSPLHRVVRVDKLTLAALEATLLDYWQGGEVGLRIPTLRDVLRTPESCARSAERVRGALVDDGVPEERLGIVADESRVGGGSFADLALESRVLEIRLGDRSAVELHARLRRASPPVVARVRGDAVRLDLRTVEDDEIDLLVAAVRAAMRGLPSSRQR